MPRTRVGHLRLVEDEPRPAMAVAGGDGGDGPRQAGWTIVERAVTRIAGRQRTVEIAGWHSTSVDVSPDWLCEPAERDRPAQLARYAEQAIGHVWLIDPATRTIDIYRFEAGAYVHVTTSHGDARLRAEPFSAFDLDVSSIWSDE